MNLYVFSSNNTTNIWAGVGAGLWAVSERDPSQMRGLQTKAAKMLVGSCGVIWSTETQADDSIHGYGRGRPGVPSNDRGNLA